MDPWKSYDITHRDHVYCNPLSAAKFEEMIDILRLPSTAAVLDIACGKGEFLVRLAARYGVSGVGVDISPFYIRDARQKAAARVPGADLTFVEADAGQYDPGGRTFTMVACVGASWIWGGYRGTLQALRRFTQAGGLIVTGEPYWRKPPDPAYLEAERLRAEDFSTHHGNVGIGLEEGLIPLFVIAGSEDDWDRYESLQWQAAERYAAVHVEDPDAGELLARTRASREAYLRWGRETLGWALYLFRHA